MPIRPATVRDVDALGQLWVALWDEQARHDARLRLSDDALDRWRTEAPDWVRDDGVCLLVVVEAGEVDGFAHAELWTPPPIYQGGLEVHLDELYVRPAVRGRGWGAGLVRAVAAWAQAQGAHALRMGVLAQNPAARRFWERQGATPLSMTYRKPLPHEDDAGPEAPRSQFGF